MSKSIREIQQEFSQADDCERKVLYEQYADDPRAGVTALIAKYKKQEEKLEKAMQKYGIDNENTLEILVSDMRR